MSWNLYVGVHESGFAANQIDLANCPAGAIRLMTNLAPERWGRARRCVSIWNAGLWPIPCLKTQTAPNAATYRTYVQDMLDGDPTGVKDPSGPAFVGIAPVGGPRKTDVFEVGNEPGQGSPTPVDLGPYLDCLVNSYALIRARGLKVVLAAMTGKAAYTPPGGTMITGPAAVSRAITDGYRGANWSMIDGFALHNYGDSVANLINGWQSQRNLFPNSGAGAKFMMITENGWPNPWPGTPVGTSPFQQACTEPVRIARILTMWPNILKHAEAWNLWCYSWFCMSDYGDASGWDERCGLITLGSPTVAGTKKSGSAVVWNGAFATGETFTRSWDALDRLPKTTLIGAAPPPPSPTPPDAVTTAATLVGDTTAQLNGTVDANGLSTSYYFEYDTVSGAPYAVQTASAGVGSGTDPVAVFRLPTGLTPSTTYYFRAVAVNNDGTDVGNELSFTTAAVPPPVPDPVPQTASEPPPLRLQEALKKSHTLAVRAEVLRGGDVVAEL
jgi:hypothetical protein